METVFLTCPIHERKAYCIEQFFENILRFTYPNIVYYFVDNSDRPEWSEDLVRRWGFDIDFFINDQNLRTHQKMAACNEITRRKFLESDCDYFLSLECDVIPPLDCIEIMLAHKKPVVSLPYFTGEGADSFIVGADVEQYGNEITNQHVTNKLSYWRTTGQLEQVGQPGIGIMLAKRHVIETHHFKTIKGAECHADTNFFFDLARDGIKVFSDTAHIVTHRNQPWEAISDFKA